jgi:uncharacterized membrane protein YgcG
MAAVAAAAASVLLVFASGGSATAVAGRSAGVDDFTFQSMSADYTLGRAADGTSTLRAVETFVAVFPDSDQNHGMRRTIPDSYNGQPLDPHLVSITDGSGHAREAETSSDGNGAFTMTSRSPGFVHGAQTYVFTYTLRHVTWTFEQNNDDEFYWDVNGVDWAQPFGQISATVHLDPSLAKARTGQQSCYVGAQGATQRCSSIAAQSAAGGAVTVSASAAQVAPYQTLTVAVGFAKGTFTPYDTSYFASPWGWLQTVAGLGMLGVIAMAIVYRSRRLNDAPGRPTIIAEYTPPPGTDALQSAVLLGVTKKAIPAGVLEQAVGGSIRIVEGKRKVFGGHHLQAQLLDVSLADRGGRILLAGMFGDHRRSGAVFEFGRKDTRFAEAAKKSLVWGQSELTRRGMRRTVPLRARAVPILLAVVCAGVMALAGVQAWSGYVTGAAPSVVLLGGVVGLLVVIALLRRTPLSAAGAETRDHLRGLKTFIAWAEADRIRMLQSPSGAERVRIDASDPRQVLKLYEKLLPYAVVFGQEKKWAEQLAVMYGTDASPYWYTGTHDFNAAAFSADIGSLSAAASSSSSTSGGADGGGSAGDGGGGGGGGGV